MNVIKKNKFGLYSSGGLLLFWIIAATPMSPDISEFYPKDSFFSNPAAFGDGYGDMIQTIDIPMLKTIPPEQVIGFLQFIGAIPILEQPFYLRSNPLNTRQLIDLPTFEPRPCPARPEHLFMMDLFYNETTRMFYTGHSSNMRSYLALEETTLIELIQQVINSDVIASAIADPNQNINIRRILNLFSTTAIQERRLGFMFQIMHTWEDRITLRVAWPLYYLERNFFLTPSERRLIEAEFGAGTPQEQQRFQDRFIISDQLGFGDARVELTFMPYDAPASSYEFGIALTLPLAFPLLQGLKGHHFHKSSRQPEFDFENLYEQIALLMSVMNPLTQDQIIANLKQQLQLFGEGALDRLAGALLESDLGNGGHTGIAWMLRTHTHCGELINKAWADPLVFSTRVSLEFFCAATEKRFYAKQPSHFEFVNRNFNDESRAQANLTFLQEELVDRSYPIALDTRIQPGFLFRITNHTCYSFNEHWHLLFGSDWWIQGKETIEKIYAPLSIREQLLPVEARRPFAYQSKLHGGLIYSRTDEFSGVEWALSLYYDGTTISSGIGADATLSFGFDLYF